VKSFILSILIALPLMSLADEANSEAVSAAQAAVIEWLALTDQGQFEPSWDEAAPLFQAGITKSDWQRSLNAVRLPLGELISREVAKSDYSTALPGAPDGEYVVVTLDSSFANKARAVETVTAMRAPEGDWRVAGYFIR
jgi:hypothetical protein